MPEHKETLLAMAKAWMDVAEQAERNAKRMKSSEHNGAG